MRQRVGVEHRRRRNRIVGDVPRVRESAQEFGDERGGRRAGDRRRQDPDGAALLPDSAERRGDLLVDIGPRASLTAVGRVRQPLAVIETQNRCLAHGACRAARQRVIGIAFDLERPAVTGGDEQSAARLAGAARRSVEQRPAGDQTPPAAARRESRRLRAPGSARPRRRHEREACGLQKAAPGGEEVGITIDFID